MHGLGTRAAASLVLLGVVGCYDAAFDENADGVFTCNSDDECVGDSVCVMGFCVGDAGPTVNIDGPEESSVFDAGAPVVFPLAVSGASLELAEPNGSAEPGKGYIVIEVDGAELPTKLIDGSLEGGASELLDLGTLAGGFHRIRVRAVGLDNADYDNPSAVADVGIWVNDQLPHVGIRRPWPGDRFVAGSELEVTVVSLNCAFIDPEFAASDRVDEPQPEGHTHVYLDRRAASSEVLDYPACLPDCNFDYAPGGSIKPVGQSAQSLVEGTLMSVPSEAGDLKLTASFNYTGHFPYPAASLDPAVWNAMPELREGLVNDSITIALE